MTLLGLKNTTVHLHDKAVTLPTVVLASEALDYAVILGLDFIFFSGLRIDISEQKYSFKSDPAKEYPFQPGNASEPLENASPKKRGKQTKKMQLTLLSAILPPQSSLTLLQTEDLDDQTLIQDAVNQAHLHRDEK